MRRTLRGKPMKDLCSGTMRMALHLSDVEHAALRRLNPDTLGAPDTRIACAAWKLFIESPDSARYRVREV